MGYWKYQSISKAPWESYWVPSINIILKIVYYTQGTSLSLIHEWMTAVENPLYSSKVRLIANKHLRNKCLCEMWPSLVFHP